MTSAIWGKVFDNFGVKTVTKTDKKKLAYVLNNAQIKVLTAAGLTPVPARLAVVPKSLTVLFDSAVTSVNFSYYGSERTGSGRLHELRLGREIISSWLEVGDSILIGNIGNQIFAGKLVSGVPEPQELIEQEIVRRSTPATVIARAKAAKKGKPESRETIRNDFVRNPYVVAAALLRAKGNCEMPGCTRELFKKPDGSLYLEVHHVTPLGEGGEDVMENVAALCPHCHREQHFGKDRLNQRSLLSAYVGGL